MKRTKESIFTQEARLTYWQTRPHVCGICGKPIESFSDMHLDHIIPVSRGGETQPENIQLAHAACNLRKGDKVPGGGSPARAVDYRVDGFASHSGWYPLCYSVENGWYGIAVSSIIGALCSLNDVAQCENAREYFRLIEGALGDLDSSIGSEAAWSQIIDLSKAFSDRFFDHEVDVEKAISIYRKKIAPYFFDAMRDILHNSGVKYSETPPHRVQYYDRSEDWRRR